ncbi:Proline-serine-threonine phosphatase interacting protein [Entamoeba marina]
MSIRETLSRKIHQVKTQFNFSETTCDPDLDRMYKGFKYQEVGMNRLYRLVSKELEFVFELQNTRLDIADSLINLTEPTVEVNCYAQKYKTTCEIESMANSSFKQKTQKMILTPLVDLKKSFNILGSRYKILKERHEDVDRFNDQLIKCKNELQQQQIKEKYDKQMDLYYYLRMELMSDMKNVIEACQVVWAEVMFGIIKSDITKGQQIIEVLTGLQTISKSLEQQSKSVMNCAITTPNESCIEEELRDEMENKYNVSGCLIKTSQLPKEQPIHDETKKSSFFRTKKELPSTSPPQKYVSKPQIPSSTYKQIPKQNAPVQKQSQPSTSQSNSIQNKPQPPKTTAPSKPQPPKTSAPPKPTTQQKQLQTQPKQTQIQTQPKIVSQSPNKEKQEIKASPPKNTTPPKQEKLNTQTIQSKPVAQKETQQTTSSKQTTQPKSSSPQENTKKTQQTLNQQFSFSSSKADKRATHMVPKQTTNNDVNKRIQTMKLGANSKDTEVNFTKDLEKQRETMVFEVAPNDIENAISPNSFLSETTIEQHKTEFKIVEYEDDSSSDISIESLDEFDKADSDMKEYKAIYDYKATEDLELTFKKGDIIKVYSCDDDWWEGEINGKRGFIPSNFLQEI